MTSELEAILKRERKLAFDAHYAASKRLVPEALGNYISRLERALLRAYGLLREDEMCAGCDDPPRRSDAVLAALKGEG